jgi:hypothetical protein
MCWQIAFQIIANACGCFVCQSLFGFDKDVRQLLNRTLGWKSDRCTGSAAFTAGASIQRACILVPSLRIRTLPFIRAGWLLFFAEVRGIL